MHHRGGSIITGDMTLERWAALSLRDQMGHIAAEVLRARAVADGDETQARPMIERALALADLSLEDPRWRENPLPFLTLREYLARAYAGERDALDVLCAAL